MASYSHNELDITSAPQTSNSSPLVTSASSVFNASIYAWQAFDHAIGIGHNWASIDSTTAYEWLKVDLGSGVQKSISAYTISIMGLGEYRFSPTTWKMQGSNDNSSWDDLDSQTNVLFSDNEMKTFTLSSPSAPYRYFRLYITAKRTPSRYCGVGELELIGAESSSSTLLGAKKISNIFQRGF